MNEQFGLEWWQAEKYETKHHANSVPMTLAKSGLPVSLVTQKVSDSPLRSIDCSYSDLKFTLFGTDLQKIPCFKKTFTVSTYCGIAAGLACFF
ncbi:hypothetical protein TNCV_1630762 [Trichonephila clavipes]|nr:hypothetical protein TNCV_1630762 [Trichonephila clavipes]